MEQHIPTPVVVALLKALETLVESHGYISYLSDEEKEAEPDVVAARSAIARVRQLGLGN